jgi:hypothetical protein
MPSEVARNRHALFEILFTHEGSRVLELPGRAQLPWHVAG